MNLAGIDWGDAPTWCGVAAASAAGVFAALSFGKLKQQVEDQRRGLADQRELINHQMARGELELDALRDAAFERRSVQAKQVRVTTGFVPADPSPDSEVPGHWWARVFNASEAIVNDVAFESGQGSFGAAQGTNATIAPLLNAGGVVTFTWVVPTMDDLIAAEPRVVFRDVEGQGWTVSRHGQLAARE
jgi:hypothetical protein